jgi:DedD protein
LTYAKRLEHQNGAKEELKPQAPKPTPPKQPAPQPKPAAPAAAPPTASIAQKKAPAPAPAAPPAAAPAADGEFTVQIAAYNARAEADSVARRLNSKGYSAYVLAPGNGAAMYRVRVGRFKTRHDAQPVADRLQREEQYKPWITR